MTPFEVISAIAIVGIGMWFIDWLVSDRTPKKKDVYDFLKTNWGAVEKEKGCTCLTLPKNHTSQDVNQRYLSMQKCPIHSKVPDRETRRYERTRYRKLNLVAQKGFIYLPVYTVMQAVEKGKTGQVGMKAYDAEGGWRSISAFPTREDARAYLLDVLDTVKREQASGHRTKRNLDPNFSGGLDFYISFGYVAVPEAPLKKRGWQLNQMNEKYIRKHNRDRVRRIRSSSGRG